MMRKRELMIKMFRKHKKNKYIAVFVIKEQGNYEFDSLKVFTPLNDKIKIGEGLYLINIEKPTFKIGLKRYFFIDLHSGVQISFRKILKAKYSPKMLNMLFGEHVVEDLVSGMGKKPVAMNFMLLLGCIALGGAFGYIIGGFI